MKRRTLTLADLKQVGDEWNERGDVAKSAALRKPRDLHENEKLRQQDHVMPVGVAAVAAAAMNWWGWL